MVISPFYSSQQTSAFQGLVEKIARMKFVYTLVFFLSIHIVVSGQITGIVIDSSNQKPIDKSLIGLVIKALPGDTSYFFTDENGQFSISPVPTTPFTLVFNQLGFQPVAKYFPVNTVEKQIKVGKIILAPRVKMLGEVVVTAMPIIIKEDTIEYRADAFKVKENATTEDLLKKLPGVSVDKDGNVTAQGKTVTKVRVNGKDFFGGDVQTATKELPANIIEKVQVIDDYGDQATVSGIKDGEPEKIINLTIKKDKNKGVFGRATAGIGTNDRYATSFNANYFNNKQQISLLGNSNNANQSLFNFGGGNSNNVGMGNMMRQGQRMMSDMGGGSGIMNAAQNGDQSFISGGQSNNSGITTAHSTGLNYRDDWGHGMSVYGSYSYSNRDNNAIQTTSTQNIFESGSLINNQNSTSNNRSNNHRLFLNFEYQIDSFNYLKVSPTITYANTHNNTVSAFDYNELSGLKTSEGFNNSQKATNTPNYSGTILYNHRFRKRGRNISANLSLGTGENNSDQNTQNNTTVLTTPINNFTRYQYINQLNNTHNYGIRITYSEPLSKTRNLDIAASHNLNYTRNNKSTYDANPANLNPILLPGLSNDFENNFFNNRVGVSVRTTMKKYNYTLGVSMQPVSLKGKSLTKDSSYKTINRINVFPIARFQYNFSKTKTLSANYSGNATQPTFTQLQEVVDNSNPQFVTKGNPLLKPSINHNINFSYNNFHFSSGRVIFTNFTFSSIQNQIVNNVISTGRQGGQLSIPENVNGYFNVNGFYLYSRPFKQRKYVLTLTGSINYNHNINLIDSIRNIGKNWIGSQGFVFEFNYKTWLQWGLGASYSLNDVKYTTPGANTLSTLQNTNSSALTLTSNIDIDLKEKWILKYNFDYTFNYGINAAVSQNLAILNASIERQLFKKKNGVIKLAAYDLFNQNTNISRSVTANAITDSRSNRLTRYFLLSFTYRLQKFQGQRPQTGGFRGMGPQENKNAEIKVF
ncbi:MAG: hypothetical protein RLY16_1964 [Bacteroidota bacterium]